MIFAVILLSLFSRCTVHEPSPKDLEGPPTMSSSVENAPVVSFCDLVRHAAQYDKMVVRTRAILRRDQENQSLDDPGCEGADAAWVDFDPSYVYSDEKLRRRLTELIRPRASKPVGVALVTVVGRFEGPAGGPYGHLDGYRSKFSIFRLEQAEEAKSSANKSR